MFKQKPHALLSDWQVCTVFQV